MGQYWTAACHKCRMKFQPMPMKWREIAMSRTDLMKVGLCFMLHNGHGAELVCDEWSEHDVAEYSKQPECDFEDMREGVPYIKAAVSDGKAERTADKPSAKHKENEK